MSDASPPPVRPDVRYEKSDVRIGAIIRFGITLAVLGVIIHGSVIVLFGVLKEREDAKYPPLPPLVARERATLPRDLHKIPAPRLQKSDMPDMQKLREREDALLDSYGWVDREGGIVRIPIDEAIKLLANPKTAALKGVRSRPVQENKR